MASDAQRNPAGAQGNWFIDRRCINCGAARHVAPGLIVERGNLSVFDRQPQSTEEVHQASLAAELCPTRSIRTESHLRPLRRVYPHAPTEGVYLCGHNHRSSHGAHSYFVPRASGNLLIDSPRYTKKLVEPLEQMGDIASLLLSHRDDVADADKWAEHFGAEVFIHRDDHSAAPFATHVIEGSSPSEPTRLGSGITAIPEPGHTKGSVVYLVEDAYLFTGDSLTWDYLHDRMRAFREGPAVLLVSAKGVADRAREPPVPSAVFGPRSWSPWKERHEMRRLLLELTERM